MQNTELLPNFADLSVAVGQCKCDQGGDIEHCEVILIAVGTSLLANQGIYGDKRVRAHHVMKHVKRGLMNGYYARCQPLIIYVCTNRQ